MKTTKIGKRSGNIVTGRVFPEVLKSLRAAYGREVEDFAFALRARFARGALRGIADSGDGAFHELRLACRRRFDLDRLNNAEACLLLAASPSCELTMDDWQNPADHAMEAIACDVLRIARARGWSAPMPDEWPSAAELQAGAGQEAGHA
jgi:hypothetical protein